MSCISTTSSEWERYQLPEALIAGYGYGPDAGLVRTRMADGSTLQRRRHTLRPTLVDLRFPATAQELQTMEAVIDVYGFDWMDLPLRTSQDGVDVVTLHRAKFVSGYTVTARQSGTFELAITAQLETLDEGCAMAGMSLT
jgi:hypothetical protein